MQFDRVNYTMEEHKSLTTSEARRLIDEQFRTDADLRAFLLDILGLDAYRRFDGIHDRVTLLNQVLVCHGDYIAQALPKQKETQRSPHPMAQATILLPSANLSQVSGQSGPPTAGASGANRHDIRQVALISGATLLVVVWLITYQKTSITSTPQIVIIDSARIEKTDNLRLIPSQLENPEQFVRKIQKAGTENVHYEVTPEFDRDTKELLRLVVALLRKNNEEIARMRYRQPQIRDWHRDARPDAQFLVQLCTHIESAIGERSHGASDLESRSLGPIDLGLVADPNNRTQIPVLSSGTSSQKDSNASEQISARLVQARTEYENGNYYKTIEMASSVEKTSPQRAWRLIGAAACGAKRISLANNAYRRLDAPGKQYLIHMCRSRGIRYIGNRFKVK